LVGDNTDILLIDASGKIIRLPSTEIRTMGRQAAGVRLIKLDENQILNSIFAIDLDDMEKQSEELLTKESHKNDVQEKQEEIANNREIEDLKDQSDETAFEEN